jgi:hypothetical protein
MRNIILKRIDIEDDIQDRFIEINNFLKINVKINFNCSTV